MTSFSYRITEEKLGQLCNLKFARNLPVAKDQILVTSISPNALKLQKFARCGSFFAMVGRQNQLSSKVIDSPSDDCSESY